MLLIRNSQMKILGEYMRNKFEDALVVHLNHHFPEKCGALGQAGVRKKIRYGVTRAQSYGIVIENQISRYINLMFKLGRDFDSDPALPWALNILKDPGLNGASAKIDTLCQAADTHIQQFS